MIAQSVKGAVGICGYTGCDYAFHSDYRGRSGNLESDCETQGCEGANINILNMCSKPLPGNRNVVGIERDIRDAEFSRTVRVRSS